ncbi:MAG: hypothetical protein GX873_00680 [Parcubacteria group bacterium]|nr:hypothetical protein [Parcubacteria group bacterium]
MKKTKEKNILKIGGGIIIISLGIFLSFHFINSAEFHFDITNHSQTVIVDDTPKKLTNPPKNIKAIYLTANTASDEKRMDEIIDLANKKEINAVVIDLKDYSGHILFDTKSEYLKKFETEDILIKDLKTLINKLHKNGIYVIARITVFQDPVLAEKRPDLAVKSKKANGAIWKDNKGLAWIDPAAPEAWNYILVISKSVMQYGFDEINFDYVRFPSDGLLSDMSFPYYDGVKEKREVLKEFFKYLSDNLRPLGIKISADVFGLTTVFNHDMNIGQVLEDTLLYFDYVCPMVYPSHYASGFLGYKNPANYPYEVIKYSLDTAQIRINKFKEEKLAENPYQNLRIAVLRPWLQNFDLGAVYDASMIIKQKEAVYDSLCPNWKIEGFDNCSNYNGWFLWDPKNIYTPSALEDEF